MTEMKIALSIEEAADYTGIGRNTLRNPVEWKKGLNQDGYSGDVHGSQRRQGLKR